MMLSTVNGNSAAAGATGAASSSSSSSSGSSSGNSGAQAGISVCSNGAEIAGNSSGVQARNSSVNGSDGASSSSSSGGAQGGRSSEASPALWLLLLSRCCLEWAGQLAELHAEGEPWWDTIIAKIEQQGAASGLLVRLANLSWCFAGDKPQLLRIAEAVSAALGEGSGISAGLTAAGYDMGPVLQGFEAIAAFYSDHPKPAASESDAVSRKVVKLITALEAAGNACSVFAVPHCCNNPGCSNLAGASEHSIVSGRSCICGGCQVARYCGRACQRAHWKQHKPVCKMLQGAAAQHS